MIAPQNQRDLAAQRAQQTGKFHRHIARADNRDSFRLRRQIEKSIGGYSERGLR